jgi:hypothetical protein
MYRFNSHSLRITALLFSLQFQNSRKLNERKAKEEDEKKFGWNLFTATSNIKLVFHTHTALSLTLFHVFHCLLPPKTPIHMETVTERRITELPNCFFLFFNHFSHPSLSLSHSLTHSMWLKNIDKIKKLLLAILAYIQVHVFMT